MAALRRTGGNSFIVIGEQRKRGVHIDNFDPLNTGDAVDLSTGFSIDLSNTTPATIAKSKFTGGGIFTFTIPANSKGTFTVSGHDDDGNTITETITVTDTSAIQTIQTTRRYVGTADLTVTPKGESGDSGTISTVQYQQQQAAFMFRNKMPFTRFTLDGDGDQSQSESIVGGGADTLNTPGLIGASGLIEAEILPQEIIQFMAGLLNPDSVPTSEKVPAFAAGGGSNEIRAAAAYTLGAELIDATIKTAEKHTPDWPAKLKATIVGTSLAGTPKMTVTGFRKVGRPDDEKFPVTKTVTPRPSDITTTKITIESGTHFTAVSSANITGITGTITSVQLEFDTGTYKTEISLNTRNLLFEGWSLQGSKGGMPIIGLDVTPASGEININQNIRILLNTLASQVINRRLLTDIHEEIFAFNPNDPSYSDTAVSAINALLDKDQFPVVPLDFFPAWGGAFFFDMDTEPTAFTNLTMGINQNLVPSQGYTGSRKRGEPIVDDNAVRQVVLNWTGYFQSGEAANDKFHRWQEYYRDNYTAPVHLNLYNFLSNGKQYRILFEGAQFQLTEFPTVAIESRGQIPEQLTGKIVPSVGHASGEIKVSVWSDFDYQEKFYV